MLSVANLLVVWFSTPKPRQLNIFREIGELMLDLRGLSSTYWRWGGWIWTEVTREFLVLGWDGVSGHTGIACGRIQWRLKSMNQWRREHSAVEVESHSVTKIFDLHSISSWSASDLSLNCISCFWGGQVWFNHTTQNFWRITVLHLLTISIICYEVAPGSQRHYFSHSTPKIASEAANSCMCPSPQLSIMF